jgi:hydroxyethylthiazole kinase-like uncharacterized protein yjeF
VLPVLTPKEMAAADQRAIAAGTPVDVLMDRAGRAVAWAIRERLIGLYGRHAVIVCGKGNNGGDGVVVARVLRTWGARVDVFMLDDGVPRTALDRALGRADVAVDAMFGTGFRGALEGDALAVAEAFAEFSGAVVAIDIPSGVDGLTGVIEGTAVRADETVCFAAYKPGLLFEPGRSLAGRVRVADIGIPVVEDGEAPRTAVVERSDVAAWIPPRDPDAHKWRSGCFVVGGSGGMIGAPLFVSHAAMRVGAGIVWCGLPGADAAARASGTEVITKGLPADTGGALTEAAAREVIEHVDRFRALAIGPGLGRAPGTEAAVREIVAAAGVPTVVDADALHAVAGTDSLKRRAAPVVLTPHEGEFAALAGGRPGPDRLDAARSLAADTGAVVLLKGPATVIASPDGRAVISAASGPWLATAGTGDVLTGLIAGLLAQGVESWRAAAAGAVVHSRAADIAGHTGLVAGDLVGAVPAVLDELARPAAAGPRGERVPR